MTHLEKIKAAYWACAKCMKKAGGVMSDGAGCTMIMGLCKVCGFKDEVPMAPWVDYNWPEDRRADIVAKVTRD